nr:hypothetical protein [Tanacetum cinerariifolium]
GGLKWVKGGGSGVGYLHPRFEVVADLQSHMVF